MILVFYQKMTPEAGGAQKPQEGHLVEIKCIPSEKSSFVIWFRVLDTSGMEFIGSFTANGMVKSTYISSRFTYTKIDQHIISLKKFNSVFDSGTYSCASFKNNELHFGEVTRLTGEKAETKTTAPPTITDKPNQPPVCDCKGKTKQNYKHAVETGPRTECSLIILGPLAGSCGLLLLLLIIISVYCNQIRTRRCPHHYKRKPRMAAPGKQMMANRHV